ncbi:MAG TPA: alpha/beta hydrolase-fold protein [Acidobacteriota bacterium]|nr:alpha/beta hydrolase-fold protein [Acidobacteriota bacterium]
MVATISFLISLILSQTAASGRPFYDRKHDSKVFGEARNYRILLPPDYMTSGKSYPVLYFFHGHRDRYTLEHYDGGADFIPKMIDYVSSHDLIVVLPDGYVAEDYTGFYGGTPYDLRLEGGAHDFGSYFGELVAHIDGTYRTLTDRRHRAISGLSMGGFMSLWLSARYPDLLGSASAFNPGPEFYVGEKGRRVLWRAKDHVSNHTNSMVRLIRASGDYISQYHEETHAAYANAGGVNFEYRVDEYHRHWITSIAETFDFHERAFRNSTLDNVPVTWSYASPYRSFGAWGYRVETKGEEAGITYLHDVTQGGLRVMTRRWAPDGPPVTDRRITLTTAPRYRPSATYIILDHNLTTAVTQKTTAAANADGSITLNVDGMGHQISLIGPGTGAQPPVLLPLTAGDRPRLPPQTDISLPIRIYNPRGEAMKDVKIALFSEYPTVQLSGSEASIPSLDAGAFVDLSKQFRARFTAGTGYFAPTRLQLTMTFDGWYTASDDIDVLVAPEVIPCPAAIEIMDGRTHTFTVFRQRGNQGGGAPIEIKVTEGKGNGNGILEPGEEVTIWVKMLQGMDPFDKGNWHRCKVYSDSPWLEEIGNLENPKQREWTSAMERTSLIRLSSNVPHGISIPVLLDNESWSFFFTPDVRYGVEKLYQAFQLHTNHLHRYEIAVR